MKDKVEFQAYIPAFLVRLVLRGMFRGREKAIKQLIVVVDPNVDGKVL